jgi:hypothetical protein
MGIGIRRADDISGTRAIGPSHLMRGIAGLDLATMDNSSLKGIGKATITDSITIIGGIGIKIETMIGIEAGIETTKGTATAGNTRCSVHSPAHLAIRLPLADVVISPRSVAHRS